jgi:hypothetical protein
VYEHWGLVARPVEGLVRPVQIGTADGPTRGQARGPGWRSTSYGFVVPASVSDDLVEQRILEAAVGAGPDSVVTGWAGLRLLGGGFFDGLARDGETRLPVPIATNGRRLEPRDGVLLTHDRVPPDERTVRHGIACAVGERALFDEIRRCPDFRDQVVAADMAFAGEVTSIRRMRRYRWSRYWYRDVRRLDRVLPFASEHARSRPEVDLRLVWELDAGWPDPLVNRGVLDLDGCLVGIPDLLDVKRAVVGEFMGAGHRDRDQHESDVDRAARFRAVGLEIVEVVGADLPHRPRIVIRMDQAADRAALLTRRWELAPPPASLDARLDRRDAEDGSPPAPETANFRISTPDGGWPY